MGKRSLKKQVFFSKWLKIKQNTAKIEANFQVNFDFRLGWTFFKVRILVSMSARSQSWLCPLMFTKPWERGWTTMVIAGDILAVHLKPVALPILNSGRELFDYYFSHFELLLEVSCSLPNWKCKDFAIHPESSSIKIQILPISYPSLRSALLERISNNDFL